LPTILALLSVTFLFLARTTYPTRFTSLAAFILVLRAGSGPAHTQPEMDVDSSVEKARNAIFFVLGMVVGAVCLVYVLVVVLGRVLASIASADDDRGSTQQPQGGGDVVTWEDLTRRAELAGILPEERARVIRHFFEQRAMKYSSEAANGSGVASESVDSDSPNGWKAATETQRIATTGPILTAKLVDDVESQRTSPTSSEQDVEDRELEDFCMLEHDAGTCPICLNEYGQFSNPPCSCCPRCWLDCCCFLAFSIPHTGHPLPATLCSFRRHDHYRNKVFARIPLGLLFGKLADGKLVLVVGKSSNQIKALYPWFSHSFVVALLTNDSQIKLLLPMTL
jgi:hypothetical protein